MSNANLFNELVATYKKHGWELRSTLLQPATRSELGTLINEIPVKESNLDALWFSRPSHDNRDAWELRLLSQTPYALFETFGPEETEEQRAEVKQEMEERLRDYVSGK